MITQPHRIEEINLSQRRSSAPPARSGVLSAEAQEKSAPKEAGAIPKERKRELQQKINQLNTEIGHAGVALKIRVDHETGKNLIKVVDRQTGEVIREIPPEEMVRLEARIEKMIGIFLDCSM